eukprot:1144424-Pelagomonas_calceolata.AAC.2
MLVENVSPTNDQPESWAVGQTLVTLAHQFQGTCKNKTYVQITHKVKLIQQQWDAAAAGE